MSTAASAQAQADLKEMQYEEQQWRNGDHSVPGPPLTAEQLKQLPAAQPARLRVGAAMDSAQHRAGASIPAEETARRQSAVDPAFPLFLRSEDNKRFPSDLLAQVHAAAGDGEEPGRLLTVSLRRVWPLSGRQDIVRLQVLELGCAVVEWRFALWESCNGEWHTSGPSSKDRSFFVFSTGEQATHAFVLKFRELTRMDWGEHEAQSAGGGKFHLLERSLAMEVELEARWQKQRALSAVSASSRLAPAEWQSVMHCLDAVSILCLAATCSRILSDASESFAWKHVPQQAVTIARLREREPIAAPARSFFSRLFSPSSAAAPPVELQRRAPCCAHLPLALDATSHPNGTAAVSFWRSLRRKPDKPPSVSLPPAWATRVEELRCGPLRPLQLDHWTPLLLHPSCARLHTLQLVDDSYCGVQGLESVLPQLANLTSLVLEDRADEGTAVVVPPNPPPLAAFTLPRLRHLRFHALLPRARDLFSSDRELVGRIFTQLLECAPNLVTLTDYSPSTVLSKLIEANLPAILRRPSPPPVLRTVLLEQSSYHYSWHLVALERACTKRAKELAKQQEAPESAPSPPLIAPPPSVSLQVDLILLRPWAAEDSIEWNRPAVMVADFNGLEGRPRGETHVKLAAYVLPRLGVTEEPVLGKHNELQVKFPIDLPR